jgi:RNA polymerase sigma-70 factor (ECF subfamily)
LNITRKRAGTQESRIVATYLERSGFLKRFLARFLSAEDVDDVAQEAYLRAYLAEQRAPIEHPTAFLFRVAKNLALTTLTRKSRQIAAYIEAAGGHAAASSVAGVDQEIEAQQCFGLYCEAIASLPVKCRQVFLLRKVHGLSHKEIARRMELSVSSVEKHLRNGILACQEYVNSRETTVRMPAPRGKASSQDA